jgi:hypothetical protein
MIALNERKSIIDNLLGLSFLSWRKSKAIVVFVRDDVNINPRDYSAIKSLTLDKKQRCSCMQGNTKR